MIVWLARRIVITLLLPYLWRWWRSRGASEWPATRGHRPGAPAG
jgi:hypothetical protein